MAAVRFSSAFARRALRVGSLLTRRGYAETAGMPLTFSSPATAFYDGIDVKQVDVSTTTGSFGILPNHVPSIAVLKPGLMTVTEDDKMKKFFVSSGTVTINADSSVQILAEEAYPLEQLDIQAARQGLDQCRQQTTTGSEEERAEAQIGIELYEALITALESS